VRPHGNKLVIAVSIHASRYHTVKSSQRGGDCNSLPSRLSHTVTKSYKGLLNILHNTESWKRPKLLCINHQCHIDAPLWNTARYYSLACYKTSLLLHGHLSLSMMALQWLPAKYEKIQDLLMQPYLMSALTCEMLVTRRRPVSLSKIPSNFWI